MCDVVEKLVDEIIFEDYDKNGYCSKKSIWVLDYYLPSKKHELKVVENEQMEDVISKYDAGFRLSLLKSLMYLKYYFPSEQSYVIIVHMHAEVERLFLTYGAYRKGMRLKNSPRIP